jgi:hypothetical protein
MSVYYPPSRSFEPAKPAEITDLGDIAEHPFGDLLKRFVAHVSEVTGSPFVVVVTPSRAKLTQEEVSFLLSLEAQAIRDREYQERLRQAEET